MAPKPQKCAQCGKFTSEGVNCVDCRSTYHRLCIGVVADARLPARWQCKHCKSKQSKNITPLSSGSSSATTDVECNDSPTTYDCSSDKNIDLAREIKMIRSQLATIVEDTSSCRQEMATFRDEVLKLNTSIADFNKRLGAVEEKVNNFAKRLTEAEAKMAVVSGSDMGAKIERHLNERDQEAFSTDVEISGIEEYNGENPVHLTKLVAKKIGVSLNDQDIVSAVRNGRRRDGRGGEGGEGGSATPASRARLITVRLARRALKDELLRAARARRDADTSGIVTTAQPRRFYINERLTWSNRKLFRIARVQGRTLDWKYIWTKEGRVYARRDKDLPAYRIRSESDIDTVFKK